MEKVYLYAVGLVLVLGLVLPFDANAGHNNWAPELVIVRPGGLTLMGIWYVRRVGRTTVRGIITNRTTKVGGQVVVSR